MTRALVLAGIVLTFASPLEAQDFNAVRATNALNDMARAQERRAEAARQLERIQRDADKYRTERRQNDERDSRSMRRFDR
ncbi:hypothetical protein [Methylobacterium nigriterrae]|uniref:hypothetical protein n=1 Tax=Methylobacterium nigriterrae TaxID=3127512 RepID=UPI003013BB97